MTVDDDRPPTQPDDCCYFFREVYVFVSIANEEKEMKKASKFPIDYSLCFAVRIDHLTAVHQMSFSGTENERKFSIEITVGHKPVGTAA